MKLHQHHSVLFQTATTVVCAQFWSNVVVVERKYKPLVRWLDV